MTAVLLKISAGALRIILLYSIDFVTLFCISRKWKGVGCEVLISTANVLTKEGCRTLLDKAIALAPVAAIFNLAVVLPLGIIENQTVEKFRKCIAPKAKPTMFMDELSRSMCPELK